MMSGPTAYLDVQRGSQDDLVVTHAPLVKRLAYHLIGRLPPTVEVEDLIQTGMIGLLEAASNYETGRGANFETFASIRIRGAMLDLVRKNDWAPRSMPRRMREIAEAIRRVENRLGREASSQEVISEMGISADEYHRILQDAISTRLFSLEQGAFGEQEFDVAGDDGESPLAALTAEGFQRDLGRQIDALPEREKLVVALYYDEGLNLKEIGAVLDVSESRISQILGQAMLRLKSRLGGWVDGAEQVAQAAR